MCWSWRGHDSSIAVRTVTPNRQASRLHLRQLPIAHPYCLDLSATLVELQLPRPSTSVFMSTHIEAQVRQKLQQIQAVTLQKLAEDLACVKFPDRFGYRTLRRLGRNDEDQTTKGWPDAFVSTGPNEVDGIEATRQALTWSSHLKADLAHATDPKYRNLSGYVFVGGYPGNAPTSSELDEWLERFVAAGVDRTKVTILVGADLVAELCRPEYAAIRQVHLGLATTPTWFRLLGQLPIRERRLGLFQPTQDEYDALLVRPPAVISAVINELLTKGCALVQGYGAAGKTTLAELVARDVRIIPNPVWYHNLVQATEDTGGAGTLNEMTSLASRGTLFVIDNVHLDTSYANQMREHWSRHLAPLGARLLLLGRRIHASTSKSGFAMPSYELRAGIPEMLAIADRLARRDGCILSPIPKEMADSWARIFGGSDDPEKTAVDLIAFTAAVDRQLARIADGDFRLSAADAVDAVRSRYLKPLQSSLELKNILRLAALAEFEIPLMDEQLPDPVVGLAEAINIFGLVVQDNVGLEARRHNRLVHAGVGPLLLEAAGANFNTKGERLSAVAQYPGLGRRISAAYKRAEPTGSTHNEFDQAVLAALRSSEWPERTVNLYDLGNLARYAVRKGAASPETIDAWIATTNTISRLFSRSPALPAITQFFTYAAMIGLPRATAALSAAMAKTPILDTLYASRASDVAALIRASPNGGDILARIDVQAWNKGQERSPAEPVSQTIFCCRFLEASNRPELACAPALHQVTLADSKLWDYRDPSHLSHILRLARPSHQISERLLKNLTASGWLAASFTTGNIGDLCGALLSLANHLEEPLRNLVLIKELQNRVMEELSNFPSKREKHSNRPICLLGGFQSLGGRCSPMPQIDWSTDPQAARLLDEVAHSESTDAIGMYEIQLWLGIKALHQLGHAPPGASPSRGQSFLTRLTVAPAPTSQARAIQSQLLGWLTELKEKNWKLETQRNVGAPAPT